jgi:thiamine kinase-like enzyme
MNVIDDGARLWMIDWEGAGMGDPLFDLAGIAYLLDGDGRKRLLAAYFGGVDDSLRDDLDEMVAVFLACNITWSLVQTTTSDIDHDFLDFAEELLDLVR